MIPIKECYEELLETENVSYLERIKASLQDVIGGRVHHFKNVDELLKKIEE